MRYAASIKYLFIAAAIILLNNFVIVGHASAMNVMPREMSANSHHTANRDPLCVSLCMTAVKEEQKPRLSQEEQEGEPTPRNNVAFYKLKNTPFIPRKLTNKYVHNRSIPRPLDSFIKLYSNLRF